MGMFRYYDMEISEVFVFDEFLVNQIREGVIITPEHNTAMRTIIDKHFSNQSVVYISNRHFSYTVDPLTYLETSEIHNLVAIAIISKEPLKRKVAYYESSFFSKPFKVFDTLGEGMQWAQRIVLEEENK